MSVVVTGAAGGIGAACVAAFRDEGRHVMGFDAREGSAADDHHVVDLSSESCGNEISRLVGDHDVEVLVNNAAVAEYSTALDTSTEGWDRTMAVNLRAPFLIATALYPRLSASRGAVVNIASVHAVATSPGAAAYAASKGGLVALTRALALEWAPEIRVNCVLPGAVDTEMLISGLSRSGITVEQLGERHPMGRIGTPDEIAEAVVFLARSGFATGSALVVDGGATSRLSTE